MNNLAELFEKQFKLELAEKYYLMAINNSTDAMYNLANIYENQGKMKLAEKYYLMASNNNNLNATKKLNKILNRNFDIDLAIQINNKLNDHNLRMLNNILSYFCKNNDL